MDEYGTLQVREWRTTLNNTCYLISTNPALVSAQFVNEAFADDDMHWARSLPMPAVKRIIDTSLFLGVYVISPRFPPAKSASEPSSPRTPSPSLESSDNDEDLWMVGMARFMTDYVLMMYLTDVYVRPEHRGIGVSTWLIGCCKEVLDSMKHLRRLLLFTSPGKPAQWYMKMLDCYDVQDESDHLTCLTRFAGR